MKQINRLILKEILGPWVFGVAMFTVLIFAGNYLFQVSEYFVQGAEPSQVAQLTLLVLPGIVVKTFAMALLLAGLLAFGRLSSDSEVIALRASGVSILRMMRPVATFSLMVAVMAFVLNEAVVPSAAMRALEIQRDIATQLKGTVAQNLSHSQIESGRLVAMIGANSFNLGSRTLRGVTITAYDKDSTPTFFMWVPEMRYEGEKNWRTVGGGLLVAAQGGLSVRLVGEAWPPEVPQLSLDPRDLLRQSLKQLDALSLQDLRQQIAAAKDDPHTKRAQLANLEYGLWNKFALPLAALVYGLLGAPLGVRNVRTGTATGFALSVTIIFAYITIANLMNVYAMGGRIPAYAASFTPVIIGLMAAGVIIWRRNG